MATSALPPVETLSAGALHERLVSDAVRGTATDLAWCVAAYERIGQLSGKGADAAYREVRDDVARRRGGWRGMPML